jgi:hypothetical protein
MFKLGRVFSIGFALQVIGIGTCVVVTILSGGKLEYIAGTIFMLTGFVIFIFLTKGIIRKVQCDNNKDSSSATRIDIR